MSKDEFPVGCRVRDERDGDEGTVVQSDDTPPDERWVRWDNGAINCEYTKHLTRIAPLVVAGPTQLQFERVSIALAEAQEEISRLEKARPLAAPTLPEGMTAEALRAMANLLPFDSIHPAQPRGEVLRWADELEASPPPARRDFWGGTVKPTISPPPAPTAPEGHELVSLPREVVDWWADEKQQFGTDRNIVMAAACRATRDARPLSDPPTPETERVPATEALVRCAVFPHDDGNVRVERIERFRDGCAVVGNFGRTQPVAPDGTVEVLKDLS